MLEGYVTNLFVSYLGRYIKNLNKEAVTVSILKGFIQMNDVELTRLALQHFGLPAFVHRGVVGSLRINVPWTSLTSKPCELVIDDVVIVVVPKTAIAWVDAEEAAISQQEKKDQIAIYDATRSAKHEQEKSSDKGLTAKIQQAVFNNLRIVINNVVIRYEDSVSVFNKSYFALVNIKQVTLIPTDGSFNPTFIEGQPRHAHKQLRCTELSMHVGVVIDITEQISLYPAAAESNMQFREKVLMLSRTVRPELLMLAPTSLTMNMRLLIARDPTEPKLLGSCALLSSRAATITAEQYEALGALRHYFSHAGVLARARRTRPFASPLQRPAQWWRHAITQVIDEIRAKRKRTRLVWAEYAEWKKRRTEYIDLFARANKMPGSPALNAVDQKRLAALEDQMPYGDIATCRDHTFLLIEHRTASQKAAAAESGGKKGSSATATAATAAAQAAAAQAAAASNAEVLRQILSAELGMERELPPDYVHTKVNIEFPLLTIALLDELGAFAELDFAKLHVSLLMATQSSKMHVTIRDVVHRRPDGERPFIEFMAARRRGGPGHSRQESSASAGSGGGLARKESALTLQLTPASPRRLSSPGHADPAAESVSNSSSLNAGLPHTASFTGMGSMTPACEIHHNTHRGVRAETLVTLRPLSLSVDRPYLRRVKRFFGAATSENDAADLGSTASASSNAGSSGATGPRPGDEGSGGAGGGGSMLRGDIVNERDARKALRSLLATIGQTKTRFELHTSEVMLLLENVHLQCRHLRYVSEFDAKAKGAPRGGDGGKGLGGDTPSSCGGSPANYDDTPITSVLPTHTTPMQSAEAPTFVSDAFYGDSLLIIGAMQLSCDGAVVIDTTGLRITTRRLLLPAFVAYPLTICDVSAELMAMPMPLDATEHTKKKLQEMAGFVSSLGSASSGGNGSPSSPSSPTAARSANRFQQKFVMRFRTDHLSVGDTGEVRLTYRGCAATWEQRLLDMRSTFRAHMTAESGHMHGDVTCNYTGIYAGSPWESPAEPDTRIEASLRNGTIRLTPRIAHLLEYQYDLMVLCLFRRETFGMPLPDVGKPNSWGDYSLRNVHVVFDAPCDPASKAAALAAEAAGSSRNLGATLSSPSDMDCAAPPEPMARLSYDVHFPDGADCAVRYARVGLISELTAAPFNVVVDHLTLDSGCAADLDAPPVARGLDDRTRETVCRASGVQVTQRFHPGSVEPAASIRAPIRVTDVNATHLLVTHRVARVSEALDFALNSETMRNVLSISSRPYFTADSPPSSPFRNPGGMQTVSRLRACAGQVDVIAPSRCLFDSTRLVVAARDAMVKSTNYDSIATDPVAASAPSRLQATGLATCELIIEGDDSSSTAVAFRSAEPVPVSLLFATADDNAVRTSITSPLTTFVASTSEDVVQAWDLLREFITAANTVDVAADTSSSGAAPPSIKVMEAPRLDIAVVDINSTVSVVGGTMCIKGQNAQSSSDAWLTIECDDVRVAASNSLSRSFMARTKGFDSDAPTRTACRVEKFSTRWDVAFSQPWKVEVNPEAMQFATGVKHGLAQLKYASDSSSPTSPVQQIAGGSVVTAPATHITATAACVVVQLSGRPGVSSAATTLDLRSVRFTQPPSKADANGFTLTVGDCCGTAPCGRRIIDFGSGPDASLVMTYTTPEVSEAAPFEQRHSPLAEDDESYVAPPLFVIAVPRPFRAVVLVEVVESIESLAATRECIEFVSAFESSPSAGSEQVEQAPTSPAAPFLESAASSGLSGAGATVRLEMTSPTVIFEPDDHSHHLLATCTALTCGAGVLRFSKASLLAVPIDGDLAVPIVHDVEATFTGTDDGRNHVHIDAIQIALNSETYRLILQSLSMVRRAQVKQRHSHHRGFRQSRSMTAARTRTAAGRSISTARGSLVGPHDLSAAQSTPHNLSLSVSGSPQADALTLSPQTPGLGGSASARLRKPGSGSRLTALKLFVELPKVVINIDAAGTTGVALLECVTFESGGGIAEICSGALLVTLDPVPHPLVSLRRGLQLRSFTDRNDVLQVKVVGSACDAALDPASLTTLFDFFIPPLRHHLLLRDPSKTKLMTMSHDFALTTDVELCRTGNVWHVTGRGSNVVVIDLQGHTVTIALAESLDADIVLIVADGISVFVRNGTVEVPCRNERDAAAIEQTLQRFFTCGEGSFVHVDTASVNLIPGHVRPRGAVVQLGGAIDLNVDLELSIGVAPGDGPARGQHLTLICPVVATVVKRPEGTNVTGIVERVVVQTEHPLQREAGSSGGNTPLIGRSLDERAVGGGGGLMMTAASSSPTSPAPNIGSSPLGNGSSASLGGLGSAETRKILVTDAVSLSLRAPASDIPQVAVNFPPIEARVINDDILLVEELLVQLSALANSKRFRSDQQRRVMDAIAEASAWRRGVQLERDNQQLASPASGAGGASPNGGAPSASGQGVVASVLILNIPHASCVLGDATIPMLHFVIDDCNVKVTTAPSSLSADASLTALGEYFDVETSCYTPYMRPTPIIASSKRSWRQHSNSYGQVHIQNPVWRISPSLLTTAERFQKVYVERKQGLRRAVSGVLSPTSGKLRTDATHILENRFSAPMHVTVLSLFAPQMFVVESDGGEVGIRLPPQDTGEVLQVEWPGSEPWDIPLALLHGKSSLALEGTSRRLVLRAEAGRLRLIFLSSLVFRNALDIPITLLDSRDTTTVAMIIPAGADSNAYDAAAQHSFFIAAGDGAAAATPSPLPLSLGALGEHRPTDFTLVAAPSPASTAVGATTATSRLNLLVTVEDDGKLVVIQYRYAVCNNLGRTVYVRAFQGRGDAIAGEGRIENGGRLPLRFFDPKQSLKLALQLEQVSGEVMTTAESTELFSTLAKADRSSVIRMKDSNNTTFYVHVSIGTHLCALHVAFWVFNQTEFSILLTDSTITKTLTAGQMDHTGIPPSHGAPFLLGCKSADVGSVLVKVGLDGKWSESFKLDFGSSGVAESMVEGTGLIRSVNYTVQFPRYQKGIPPILRFTPRWILVNRSATRLLFRITNKKSTASAAGSAGTAAAAGARLSNSTISDVIVDLKPGATHSSCDNGKAGNSLSLQHVLEDRNSALRPQWSNFVPIDEAFERTVNLWAVTQRVDAVAQRRDALFPASDDTRARFDVPTLTEISNTDAFDDDALTTTVRVVGAVQSGVLVISVYEVAVAPLVIQNRLGSFVRVRQRDSIRCMCIAPRTTVNFHWDDPEGDRVVVVNYLDGSNSSRTIDFGGLEGRLASEKGNPPAHIRVWRSATDRFTCVALTDDLLIDRVLHHWKVSWAFSAELIGSTVLLCDGHGDGVIAMRGSATISANLDDRELSSRIGIANFQADDCVGRVPVLYRATPQVDPSVGGGVDFFSASMQRVVSDSGVQHVRGGKVRVEPVVFTATDEFLARMVSVFTKDYVQSIQLKKFDDRMAIQTMGTRAFVNHVINNSAGWRGGANSAAAAASSAGGAVGSSPGSPRVSSGSTAAAIETTTSVAAPTAGGRLLIERYDFGAVVVFFSLKRQSGRDDPLREHLGLYALMVPDVKEARFTWGDYPIVNFLTTASVVQGRLVRFYWTRATDQWHKLTSVGNFMDKLTKATVKLPPPPRTIDVD